MRRHLQLAEIESALRRGKSVECFLGSCERNGMRGIRWLSVSTAGEAVVLSIFESADLGTSNYVDVYSFGPLDEDLDTGEPDEVHRFSGIGACIELVEQRFPGSSARFVNHGLVQDEYADYLAKGRSNA